MKWPFFSRRVTPADDFLSRYHNMRRMGRDLNVTLVKQLPKSAVPECGKKLGIFKAGTLILNNDDEIAVLYDYCLYHFRRDHKTVIDRHFQQGATPIGSPEMDLMQAMLNARFSVFDVLEIKPRRGALIRDMITDATVDLVDIGLAETGSPGVVLVGRLLPLPGFHMSSGTLIPLSNEVYQSHIMPIIKKFFPDPGAAQRTKMSHAQEAAFVAQLIRVSLQMGGMDNVFYSDMEQST